MRTGAEVNLGLITIDQGNAYDYIIYPAFTLSVITLVVVSFLTPAPPEEKWRPFEADV